MDRLEDGGVAAGMQGLPAEQSPAQSPEWYVRTSADFSSLVTDTELAWIERYTSAVAAHAHTIEMLWQQEPFRQDVLVDEGAAIVELSEKVDDTVATLKNTVVRFLRASRPAGVVQVRAKRRGRRIGRRDPVRAGPEPADGGSP